MGHGLYAFAHILWRRKCVRHSSIGCMLGPVVHMMTVLTGEEDWNLDNLTSY